MNISQTELANGAQNYANQYLSQQNLGQDEKLQMLSCAYAFLYLKASSKSSMNEFAEAHELIAKCFERLGDSAWATKHRDAAKAYLKAMA